ncbi:MAG: hypothetical protein MRZ52_03425 [Oscillospiraceae bacterium]|nr:hypothetical protein [Oscillospiraceae bacterium]
MEQFGDVVQVRFNNLSIIQLAGILVVEISGVEHIFVVLDELCFGFLVAIVAVDSEFVKEVLPIGNDVVTNANVNAATAVFSGQGSSVGGSAVRKQRSSGIGFFLSVPVVSDGSCVVNSVVNRQEVVSVNGRSRNSGNLDGTIDDASGGAVNADGSFAGQIRVESPVGVLIVGVNTNRSSYSVVIRGSAFNNEVLLFVLSLGGQRSDFGSLSMISRRPVSRPVIINLQTLDSCINSFIKSIIRGAIKVIVIFAVAVFMSYGDAKTFFKISVISKTGFVSLQIFVSASDVVYTGVVFLNISGCQIGFKLSFSDVTLRSVLNVYINLFAGSSFSRNNIDGFSYVVVRNVRIDVLTGNIVSGIVIRIRTYSCAENRKSGGSCECKSENSLFHFEFHPPYNILRSRPVSPTAAGFFGLACLFSLTSSLVTAFFSARNEKEKCRIFL